jgi:hypothetical protein
VSVSAAPDHELQPPLARQWKRSPTGRAMSPASRRGNGTLLQHVLAAPSAYRGIYAGPP